jgi:hypothetical protein
MPLKVSKASTKHGPHQFTNSSSSAPTTDDVDHDESDAKL